MIRHPERVKRLIIKGVNQAIGDTVMAIPLLKKIRTVFPNARITLVCPPFAVELLKNNPEIDEFVPCDLKLSSKLKVIFFCLTRFFQVGVCVQRSFEAAFMFRLGLVRYIIGYDCDYRAWLLNEKIRETEDVLKMHTVAYYLNILKNYDVRRRPCMRLHLSRAQKNLARDFLPGKTLIGINPGAQQGTAKRWIPSRYKALAEKLLAMKGGGRHHVAVFGSEAEKDICRRVTPKARSINLAGRTTLTELAAFISKCRLFVTNDTGSMHIAAALGVPTVVIVGPTEPSRTGPWKTRARVVSQTACPNQPCVIEPECKPGHHRCMKAVTVDMVYTACLKLLKDT